MTTLRLTRWFAVEGRPTVCIKDGRHLDDAAVEKIRRKLWNLGATTLLIVERPNQVRVFSTFSKPAEEDSQGEEAQLKAETIEQLKAAELALRLRQLVRRIETGAIYRDHKQLFNPSDTVDQVLLDNLKAARNLLSPIQVARRLPPRSRPHREVPVLLLPA